MCQSIAFLLLLFLTGSCNKINQDKLATDRKPNDLINETSPYLLQHAYNPVDWKPWGDKALEQAKTEDKLIIISIGYSSCHWCHVMEEESFENDTIARIMNDNFVNIKVDREERPDIDQIYMDAVQMMTGSGGWPLNVIALPDGRPLYGGTYHVKSQWKQILNQMSELYLEKPEDLRDYAQKLTEGIKEYDLVKPNPENPDFNREILDAAVDVQKKNWDMELGGTKSAPKFPLPNNLEFIMRYGFQADDTQSLDYLKTTLDHMAFGGIYDQVGGGFSRYSTDRKWHVPHFEKMLYDNAQLVSLYSKAFSLTKNELYKQTVIETLKFVETELMNDQGGFYSSLDADSRNENEELKEGSFYVWTQNELKLVIGEDFNLFKDYYNINSYGLWENDEYVLIRTSNNKNFFEENNLSELDLLNKVTKWKKLLKTERSKRNPPRLDDKILTTWNGLMLEGYIDAYMIFQDRHYLEVAEKNAHFLLDNLLKKDGGLNHNYKDGKSSINGYLEDYATVISAFIKLYAITAEEKYLQKAKDFTEYTLKHFYNEESGLFYFTSDEDSRLITRKTDIYDNVISSSNSIMANNIFKLSHYYSNSNYRNIAETMLNNVLPRLKVSPSSFSNWLQLLSDFVGPYYEVAISGKEAKEKLNELSTTYLPNVLYSTAESESDIPLMKNRFTKEATYIYVCVDGSCKLPVTEPNRALQLINKKF